MNMDHTKKYTLNGVFVDTKEQEVLAGRYAMVQRQKKKGGMGAKLVGAAAGAAVGGPIGAVVGFFLIGNKKK